MNGNAALRNGRTPPGVLTAILFAAVFSGIAGAQDKEVAELINAVKAAPTLYRTPEAADYFSRLGQAPSPQAQQDREPAIAGLRAAIKLGDMGYAAREAVPAIIEAFPRLEHVVVKRSVHYTPGNGLLDDWVQTYLVTEKNNFIFSSAFIEYASITKCENWIEASPVTTFLSKKTGRGGKIIDAVADIFIILRLNAGACALARITGNDLGANQESWRAYAGAKNASPPPSVRESSPAGATAAVSPGRALVVGGKYKLHLITGDDLVGTVTSKDDSSMVLKNEEGVPYSFRTVLIEKFESLSSPAEPGAAEKRESADRVETGPLNFEDLVQGNLVGKMMEIRIKNGSIFKGTLVQVTGETARINVEGSEISVSRNVIIGIRLLIK
jgi:hypothetical protein